MSDSYHLHVPLSSELLLAPKANEIRDYRSSLELLSRTCTKDIGYYRKGYCLVFTGDGIENTGENSVRSANFFIKCILFITMTISKLHVYTKLRPFKIFSRPKAEIQGLFKVWIKFKAFLRPVLWIPGLFKVCMNHDYLLPTWMYINIVSVFFQTSHLLFKFCS